ncbi:MAG: hypothetical protein J6U05_07335 [Neisseriaceae bacterium]|nr:hypothetical protein [Neisseriaceae bacterium]MBO7555569.1 hypothetical protein [Neisseriaceae bacterium]
MNKKQPKKTQQNFNKQLDIVLKELQKIPPMIEPEIFFSDNPDDHFETMGKIFEIKNFVEMIQQGTSQAQTIALVHNSMANLFGDMIEEE